VDLRYQKTKTRNPKSGGGTVCHRTVKKKKVKIRFPVLKRQNKGIAVFPPRGGEGKEEKKFGGEGERPCLNPHLRWQTFARRTGEKPHQPVKK